MFDFYNVRIIAAEWLCHHENGEPMIWFIKHFDTFNFKTKEEAESFIITFSYIYSIYQFEGFIYKHTVEYISIESFLRNDEIEDTPLTKEQLSNMKIIEDNLDRTYVKLFTVFKSPYNLLREFISIYIEKDIPSFKAHNFVYEKGKEYGFN